jgi:hypothetical protein
MLRWSDGCWLMGSMHVGRSVEEKNIQSSQPIDSCHIVSSHVRVLSASAAGSHRKLPSPAAHAGGWSHLKTLIARLKLHLAQNWNKKKSETCVKLQSINSASYSLSRWNLCILLWYYHIFRFQRQNLEETNTKIMWWPDSHICAGRLYW